MHFFGQDSIPNPAGGAYRAPWDPLTWSEGAKFVGKGGERGKMEGKGRDGREHIQYKLLVTVLVCNNKSQEFEYVNNK